MSQPDLILTPFAENATPGTIEPIPETRDPDDLAQRASWDEGFPAATMIPEEVGGLPPRGQDFNGVLNAITKHTVYQGGGGQYKWSQEWVDAKGGYAKGSVLQSDDGLTAYVSTKDNNTSNFNTTPAAIGTDWEVYSGPTSAPGWWDRYASTIGKALATAETERDGREAVDAEMAPYDSVQEFIESEPDAEAVRIVSYYGGWAATVEGPKGGFAAHKTGYTADSPSVGDPVAPSTIGTGDQAGLFWTADGAEWRYIPGDVVQALQFGVRADGITNDHESLSNADTFARESGLPLLLPPGTIVHEGVAFRGAGREVYGAGKSSTILYRPSGSGPVVSWGDPSVDPINDGIDGQCHRGRLAGLTIRGNPSSTAGLVVCGILDDNPNWTAASRANRIEDIRIVNVGAGPGLRNSAWKNQFDDIEVWDCYQGIEIGRESHSCLFNSPYVQGCTAEALIIPDTVSQGDSRNITFDTPVFQNSGGTEAMIAIYGGSSIQFFNIYSEGILGNAPNIMLIAGHADDVSVYGMAWSQNAAISTRKDITVLRLNGGARTGYDISNVRSFSDCNEVLRIGPYTGTRCRVHAVRCLGATALNGDVVDQSILKLTYGEYNGLQHLADVAINGKAYLGYDDDESPILTSGTGTPQGSVTAPVGSFYARRDGGVGRAAYIQRAGGGGEWRAILLAEGGSTGFRPTDAGLWMCWFDSTLNKPIWWNGTAWVDATGTVV